MKKKNKPAAGAVDAIYLCPSASWGDMTGLIPADTCQDDAEESYEELYPYRADQAGKTDRA